MLKLFNLMSLFIFSIAITNAQGLKFTPQEQLNEFTQIENNTYGFSEDIPSNYSLEKFVPQVLEQSGGTCVGFSSLYYALSTMYNFEFNITDPKGKFAHSFDPYFIYSIVNNEVDHCDDGLFMYEATELLYKIGAKKLFFPPYLTCESNWDQTTLKETVEYTSPYSLKEFYVVDMENPDLIDFVKKIIYYDIPVVAGFSITESLYPRSSSYPNGVSNSGLWTPSELEDSIGGHAMCIVGYNDQMYGGSFRVVNSWGDDYGDNGFIWIRYKDFKKYASEAYVFELNDNIKEDSRSQNIQMQDNQYTRFRGDWGSYEGQELQNKLTGFAIQTTRNNTYYMGYFEDGESEGFTIFIDDDGIFTANAVDDKLYDISELGFAADSEIEETEIDFKNYIKNLNPELQIRKTPTTKLNDKEKIEL